jgi:hypothetical protein
VVAAEHDRDRAGSEHLADRRLDRLVRARRVTRNDRRVSEVDHLQLREGVDLHLEVRALRGACGADRPWPEASSRPVRDEVVRRRADDRDVDAFELGGILRVGQAAEGEQARIVGFLAVGAPPLERVDHGVPSSSAILSDRRLGATTSSPPSATTEATTNAPA